MSDFAVDPDAPAELADWLRARQLLEDDETIVGLGSAGPGNMNLTLRVRTERRSFIVKQSRAWVQEYPSIPAPAERALVEAAFYTAVQGDAAISGAMPRLLAVDEKSRVLIIEDLGEASDLSGVYSGEEITVAERRALAGWLSGLHALQLGAPSARLSNRDMRALNHEHIFDLPLRPNALCADDFTRGLEVRAASLRADSNYVSAVRALGEIYLGSRSGQLLHGDFYPGSWLRCAGSPGGVAVIDPEFCFLGPAEFDVGVYLAHAVFGGSSFEAAELEFMADYAPPPGFEPRLAARFAGAEIMRRLIGVAQLPLPATLAQKEGWLAVSRALVLGTAE